MGAYPFPNGDKPISGLISHSGAVGMMVILPADNMNNFAYAFLGRTS